MWEIIAFVIYTVLALLTFLFIVADEDVRPSARMYSIFALMSLVWPILWAIYYLSGKR